MSTYLCAIHAYLGETKAATIVANGHSLCMSCFDDSKKWLSTSGGGPGLSHLIKLIQDGPY